jgi:iron(III) transport system substrate-binding protein
MARTSRITMRWLGAVVIAGVAALTGCGDDGEQAATEPPTDAPATGDWEQVLAAAEEEGEVTIYSSQVSDQLDALKTAFEEAHPDITLTVVRQDDGALLPRIEAEARTGRGTADIYVSASLPWISENTDLFVEPRSPAFDEPEYDRDANVPEGSYFVVSAFVGAYGWNTELYDGTIEDWPDLLDEELADGRIGIVNPDTPTKVSFYLNLEDNYGDDFLQQLAEQEPRVYPSLQPMVGALTSGEIAAGTFVDPLVDEQEAGAPVEWRLGEHPWGTRFYGMILDSGPHPNAAQVLAEFLISREGQEAIAGGGAAVLPDVPGAVTTMDQIAQQDVERVGPEQVQEFQARWDDLFAG